MHLRGDISHPARLYFTPPPARSQRDPHNAQRIEMGARAPHARRAKIASRAPRRRKSTRMFVGSRHRRPPLRGGGASRPARPGLGSMLSARCVRRPMPKRMVSTRHAETTPRARTRDERARGDRMAAQASHLSCTNRSSGGSERTAVRAAAAKPIGIDDGGCEETLTNVDERPTARTSITIRSIAGGSIARQSVQRRFGAHSGLNYGQRSSTCARARI